MTNSTNRRRMLKATAALVLAATAVPSVALAARSLRWGSSSLGSSGYTILEALSNVTSKYTDLKGAVQATAGTTENFVLMHRDELDIAHTTSLDWVNAKAGAKPFPGVIEANQLLSYVQWKWPILVKESSDIMTWEDLRGRTYSPSKPGSGAATASKVLFEAAGMTDDIKYVYGAWGEVYDNFGLGQVDAVYGIFTNGFPAGVVAKAEAANKLRPIEFPLEVLQAANAANAGILVSELTPETWPSLDRAINVPALAGILGADTIVTAEEGYAITKAVLDNAEEVRGFGKALGGVSPKSAVGGLLVGHPVNEGAAQYYKEMGIWRDDLTIAMS
ncbi:MAG: TAXI family TRAP transporter solute-binding subunit [Boseongicola sp. SB0676_bin_33]|nr:TAXI family TRAP transporter solute-binding subunit [Boseongicola sp. SB0676_bin_33]